MVRIPVPPRLITYGLGMSLINLIRKPLDGSGVVVTATTDPMPQWASRRVCSMYSIG